MKKYIYFHVCCINKWRNIVGNIWNQIKDSGLYEQVDEIRCSVIGDVQEFKKFLNNDPKIIFIFESYDLKYIVNNWNPNRNPIHNEQIILNRIYEDSQKEEFYCLYIHSKGVKRNKLLTVWNEESNKEYIRQTNAIQSWVDYMLYFSAYRYEKVFELLEDSDTIGVNLYHFKKAGDQHPAGYSYNGNFWWARSSYIKTLNKEIGSKYCGPEWWITSGDGNFVSMYYSKCDLYQVVFNRNKYENKPLMLLHATLDIAKFDSDISRLCKN